MSVVGLLLSRSAELLQSIDRHGKTGLHIASMHGHYQMVEILLGQGAEINAADKNGWTPLHCASKVSLFTYGTHVSPLTVQRNLTLHLWGYHYVFVTNII